MDVCLHCSTPLPDRPKGRTGPPAKYCSDRCKVAAYRKRRGLTGELRRYEGDPAPGSAPVASDVPPVLTAFSVPGPFDRQVVAFVMEARRVGAQGDRLGHGPNAVLAARCKVTATGIFEALERGFPGSDSW